IWRAVWCLNDFTFLGLSLAEKVASAIGCMVCCGEVAPPPTSHDGLVDRKGSAL
ncbi:hypothetical protein J6590_042273, partial [Homalodisca vitripennis]